MNTDESLFGGWRHQGSACFRTALGVLVVALAACSKAKPNVEPPAVSTPAGRAVASSSPTGTAPTGVWFTKERVTVSTSEGVIGLEPGTKVRKLSGNVYRWQDQKVTLTKSQVTNDLGLWQKVLAEHPTPAAAIVRPAVTPHKKAEPFRTPVRRELSPPPFASSTPEVAVIPAAPAAVPARSPGLLLEQPVTKKRSVVDHYDEQGYRYHKSVTGGRIYQ